MTSQRTLHLPGVSICSIKARAASEEGERWKLMTSGFNGKPSIPPQGLQPQNRFTILETKEEPDVPSSKGSGASNPKRSKTIRKKQ